LVIDLWLGAYAEDWIPVNGKTKGNARRKKIEIKRMDLEKSVAAHT
jgi:hypothetical protein